MLYQNDIYSISEREDGVKMRRKKKKKQTNDDFYNVTSLEERRKLSN